MKKILFLREDEVRELHHSSLRQHGGLDGLRDPGLLASAIMQAEAVYYYANGDLADIAAAYAFHIAQNQPFIDGNKRTAVSAALSFLAVNGVDQRPLSNAQIYDSMIAIAEKRLDKAGLAAVFRQVLSS